MKDLSADGGSLKKCIFMPYQNFTRLIKHLIGSDVDVTYELDGMTISSENHEIQNEDVHKELAKYFEVAEVTSIHCDDCDDIGVWIVCKDT